MLARIAGLLALLLLVAASALTFNLPAKEQACFFVFTENPDTQISFYYAVQHGGSFDIDYTIRDPSGHLILSKTKERQGDLIVSAQHIGEYSFCFSNEMSTFADKMIDFEVKFVGDYNQQFRASMPEQPNTKPIEHVDAMKRTVGHIERQLDDLKRSLQYYKTRNNRNQNTVRSTESRMYYLSILEVLLMVGMAVLQITVVQLFFKGSRKQLV